jgi:ribosomal subunit interface protein
MQVQTTGKNLSIGDALRHHIESRLSQDVARYFDGLVRAHVTVEKQRSHFRSDCTLHLATGIVLQAHGESSDAHAAFDAAASHLEKRLRRYKKRLRDHHSNRSHPVAFSSVPGYIIRSALHDAEDAEPHELSPVIIAEAPHRMPELTVGEAAMQLDISSVPFVLFRNAKGGNINILYRRDDGNIGWIDPDSRLPRSEQE